MAGGRVKVTLRKKEYRSFKELWTKKLGLVRRKYVKAIAPTMRIMIINWHVAAGKSPVKGAKNFKAYSKSYKKAIKDGKYPGKTIRPVNLKLSEDLWKSFYVKSTKKGLWIGFSDKKAVWHNEGKGYLPKRRLLPTGTNETFKPAILKAMKKKLTELVKKGF